MRLIDADAFKAGLLDETGKAEKKTGYTLVLKLLGAVIDKEPTVVDAVRVVHCRDCAYWSSGENEAEKWSWCKLHKHDAWGHDFCSSSARKAVDADA